MKCYTFIQIGTAESHICTFNRNSCGDCLYLLIRHQTEACILSLIGKWNIPIQLASLWWFQSWLPRSIWHFPKALLLPHSRIIDKIHDRFIVRKNSQRFVLFKIMGPNAQLPIRFVVSEMIHLSGSTYLGRLASRTSCTTSGNLSQAHTLYTVKHV